MNARAELAIVVCWVRQPTDILCAWVVRNIAGHDTPIRSVHVVSEAELRPGETVYSPSRASNVGIRAAVDSGARVVIKTDIDCMMLPAFIEAAGKLQPGKFLCPYCRYLPRGAGADLSTAQRDPNGCGTVAMCAEDWARLNGYDERMYGYGKEDGDLIERASLDDMRMTRDENVLYHVWHESRVDPVWYPMHLNENTAIARLHNWSCPEWGHNGGDADAG